MQIEAIKKPYDRGPEFLWRPEPVGAPGKNGPDAAKDHGNGKQNVPQQQAAVLVDLCRLFIAK